MSAGPAGPPEPTWVDETISRLLRWGVATAITVVVIGVVVTFVHHPSYLSSRVALARLTSAQATFPHTVRSVALGVRHREGQLIVMAGLLLLIATPVARVALSIGIFALEKDRFYVAITAVVLLLLLLSFLLGAAG